MKKIAIVYGDSDYGAMCFEQEYENLTITELEKTANNIKDDGKGIKTIEMETEEAGTIYIEVHYNQELNKEVEEVVLLLFSTDVLDYDATKHRSIYFIEE